MSENDAYRLVVHQRTKIDLIRESIPKPLGCLPRNNLPTWETFLIEQKLPMMPAPAGALYYSRGNLAQTLLRNRTAGGFTTADPLNRERVPSNIYEILHDPACQLQTNEQVQVVLREFGFINQGGEVICSLNEFNRFRKYLASLHNDQIRDKLVELDDLAAVQLEINRAIRREEDFGERIARRKERTEKVKAFQENVQLKARSGFTKRQQQAALLRAQFEQLREERRAAKILEDEQKRQYRQRRINALKEKEKEDHKELIQKVTLKAYNASVYRVNQAKENKIQHDQKINNWFHAKMASAVERVARERELQATYSENLKEKAAARQKKFERFREEIPMRIERKKEEAKRLMEIVRKYAMRWLNKVRARLHKEPDEKHGSVFYSANKDSLKECLKHLYIESGHEKLDDVVMNILKFKEALKRQMLLDEEEDSDEDDEE